MAVTEVANVAGSIEDRVSGIVTETLIQDSVMMGAVKDRTAEVGPGMDRLSIQLLNALALQNVPSDGTEMTAQTITSTQAELILDQHKSYFFALGDKVALESKLNLVQEEIQNGARVHAAAIDDYLLGLGAAAASAAAPDHIIQFDGSDALVDLREAKRLMDLQNVPRFDRFFVAGPTWISKLLSSSNVINVDKYGSEAPIMAGMVTRAFGFNILETTSSAIEDGGFLALQRDSISFARHMAVKFERERRVSKQIDEYALTQKYGGVVADASGVRLVLGNSTGA